MATETTVVTPAPPSTDWQRVAKGFAILIAVYFFVVYVIPKPEAVKPEGWRLTGIFIATIVGAITEPIPAGALVLMALTLAALIKSFTIEQALAGYADASVWLVIAAFIISHALFTTGMARRIALGFVRLFGKTSIGVCYSLALSDSVLAAAIPSNAARAGGVILPIARSISELYGSRPGPTANQLGSFLLTAVYQSVCVSCAMFYTGQASNPLAARLADGFGYKITWLSWLQTAWVPGVVSLAIVPLVVMWLNKPTIMRTPEAAAFARSELDKMGPMSRNERIVLGVFLGVCGLWISSSWTGMNITVVALLGGIFLLLMGVITWEDVKSNRAAWDIFVWYGGFLRLGQGINEAGVTKAFAEGVAAYFQSYGWPILLLAALTIFFYAHYFFASITAHILAMFGPFVAVLLAKGAPIGLVIFSFACLANLSAGLTNYGTTPTPMFFGQGYVALKQWWKIGLIVSIVNLIIWGTVGFGYWKLIGIW
jgi:divalent anion:Na+ symporter, DASS family